MSGHGYHRPPQFPSDNSHFPNFPFPPGFQNPGHPPHHPPPGHHHPPSAPSNPNDLYTWVDCTCNGGVPTSALQGGTDKGNVNIYVGRAFFDGEWMPAKIIPAKKAAYVAHGGKEHSVSNFQVLCEPMFDWQHCHKDRIPPNAVEGGRTKNGEILYVGRVHHEGTVTVGKVHPSHKVLYIPYDGKEKSFQDYEILVRQPYNPRMKYS